MLNFIFKSPAWLLIAQSDWMTKFILLTLLSVSIISIGIIILKYKTFKTQKQDLLKVLKGIRKCNNLDELIALKNRYKYNIGGKLIAENLSDLKQFFDKNGQNKLNNQSLERLELISDQHIDQVLILSEEYLSTLGTSSAAAPLVGLFGTVWGLIHSFVNISQEKTADISVVAPGIAEALTTTLGGLVVAIPAMIAFNYFTNELRKQEQLLSHLTNSYIEIIKQAYLKIEKNI